MWEGAGGMDGGTRALLEETPISGTPIEGTGGVCEGGGGKGTERVSWVILADTKRGLLLSR